MQRWILSDENVLRSLLGAETLIDLGLLASRVVRNVSVCFELLTLLFCYGGMRRTEFGVTIGASI